MAILAVFGALLAVTMPAQAVTYQAYDHTLIDSAFDPNVDKLVINGALSSSNPSYTLGFLLSPGAYIPMSIQGSDEASFYGYSTTGEDGTGFLLAIVPNGGLLLDSSYFFSLVIDGSHPQAWVNLLWNGDLNSVIGQGGEVAIASLFPASLNDWVPDDGGQGGGGSGTGGSGGDGNPSGGFVPEPGSLALLGLGLVGLGASRRKTGKESST